MIALLTEAGAGIGFGHLTRMFALGEALRVEGAEVRMMIQWVGDPIINVVPPADWIVHEAWRENVAELEAETLVIDSYLLPEAGYHAAAHGRSLVAVDDYYRLPYPADMVINPNVFGQPERYLPAAKAAVSGIEHVIVREPFRAAAASFTAKPELKNILLTLGGSDVHGLGTQLCRVLAGAGFSVDWVAADAAAEDLPASVRRHGAQSAAGMRDLILRNDLTVCGGGQTLHELACLGAPCVALELGDDQKGNLSCYEQNGFVNARRLHWSDPALLEAVMSEVRAMESPEARSARGRIGSKVVDGAGVFRLAKAVLRSQLGCDERK